MTMLSRRQLLRRASRLTLLSALAAPAGQLLTGCGGAFGNGPKPTPPSSFTNNDLDQKSLDNLARIASKFLAYYGVPGMSVAVAHDDKLVYAQGFGIADLSTGRQVDQNILFRVASISKSITASTVMKLAQAGMLSLDDYVFGRGRTLLGTRFIDPPSGSALLQIKLRHLLQHTTGFWPAHGDQYKFPKFNNGDPVFESSTAAIDPAKLDQSALIEYTLAKTQQIINELTQKPIPVPGGDYVYSNFGYVLIGRVIEAVTGLSYFNAVSNYLLGPSGITEMRIASDDTLLSEVQYYPNLKQSPGGVNPPFIVNRLDAAGGWIANATDIVKFLVQIDEDYKSAKGASVLKASYVDMMIDPDPLSAASYTSEAGPLPTGIEYAAGWYVNIPPASEVDFWHDGSLGGVSSLAERDDSGFCWCVLTNTSVIQPPVLRELVRNEMIPVIQMALAAPSGSKAVRR